MSGTRATGIAALVAVALTALLIGLLGLAGPAAGANLRVRGDQLVDGPGRGHPVQLRGINRSGLEYACIQGWGFFDGRAGQNDVIPGFLKLGGAQLPW